MKLSCIIIRMQWILLSSFILACSKDNHLKVEDPFKPIQVKTTSLVVLGTAQDAGSPQIGCKKDCCQDLFINPDHSRKVVSLGLIDAKQHKTYLFEATPDITTQMETLAKNDSVIKNEVVDGVFLTHAHIGHYTGLIYLGKEAMDAKTVSVYVMPKMKNFLTENGPWSQLVKLQNIRLKPMQNHASVQLSNDISVTPFLVPHRDEYSETVGYHIQGPNKSALFIPDIDKWDKWKKDILEEIQKVDYAFLDATFFDADEINNRDISEIPHPFVIESLEKFDSLKQDDKAKVVFIHFNHTNPLLDSNSKEFQLVIDKGFKVAQFNQVFEL